MVYLIRRAHVGIVSYALQFSSASTVCWTACCVHGESTKGLSWPRTTTTTAQTKPPTSQPCCHKTAKEQTSTLHTCHLTHRTTASILSLRTHNAPRTSTVSRRCYTFQHNNPPSAPAPDRSSPDPVGDTPLNRCQDKVPTIARQLHGTRPCEQSKPYTIPPQPV